MLNFSSSEPRYTSLTDRNAVSSDDDHFDELMNELTYQYKAY